MQYRLVLLWTSLSVLIYPLCRLKKDALQPVNFSVMQLRDGKQVDTGREESTGRQRREHRQAEMILSSTVSCALIRSSVPSDGPNMDMSPEQLWEASQNMQEVNCHGIQSGTGQRSSLAFLLTGLKSRRVNNATV